MSECVAISIIKSYVYHFASFLTKSLWISDFFLFSFKLANSPKSPTRLKAFASRDRSAQKRFVQIVRTLTQFDFVSKYFDSFILGSCRVLLDNNSAERINRNGKRGHPCRTPLESLNQFVVKPLFNVAVSIFAWKVPIYRVQCLFRS